MVSAPRAVTGTLQAPCWMTMPLLRLVPDGSPEIRTEAGVIRSSGGSTSIGNGCDLPASTLSVAPITSLGLAGGASGIRWESIGGGDGGRASATGDRSGDAG